MDSLNTWFQEVSRDYTDSTWRAELDVKIVGWCTIQGDTTCDNDPMGGIGQNQNQHLNDRRALTEAVRRFIYVSPDSGVSPDSVGTYDRYVFGYARRYSYQPCTAPACSCIAGSDEQGGDPVQKEFSSTDPTNVMFPTFCASAVGLYPFAPPQTTAGDVLHELLHTYNLRHAQSISSVSGEIAEYGGDFDVMGGHTVPILPNTPGETMPHIQAAHKEFFGWIDPIPIVDSSDTYKIGPLERALGVAADSIPRALKIDQKKDVTPPRYYYLEFRRPTGFDSLPATHRFNIFEGLIVSDIYVGTGVDGGGLANVQPRVLDCTPETPMPRSFDCALPIGRSFTDHQVGVCITPIAITHDTLTAVVNFFSDSDSLVNNRPSVQNVNVSYAGNTVTFRATASDPDGDALSYFWNFDVDLYKTERFLYGGFAEDSLQAYTAELYTTGTFGAGDSVTHTYPDPTPRLAHLRVSDMKGEEAPWRRVPLWGWMPDTLHVPTSNYPTIKAAVDSADGGEIVVLAASGSPYDYTILGDTTGLGIGFGGKRITLAGASDTVRIDLTGTGRRAFHFDNQENGRSAVKDLRIVGGSAIVFGGAGFIEKKARPVFVNCVFEDCTALLGGAFHCSNTAQGIFRQCTFKNNTGAFAGGAVSAIAGIGHADFHIDQVGGLILDECTLIKNRTDSLGLGGAVYFDDVRYDLHDDPPPAEYSPLTAASCLIVQNSTGLRGGGMYISSFRKNLVTVGSGLIGNSIIDNRVTGGGALGHGIFLTSGPFGGSIDSVGASNCVLWDHWQLSQPPTGLLQTSPSTDSLKVLLNSCLLPPSWWDSGHGNVLTNTGPSVIQPRPPLDALDGEYGLRPYSPCIDAGRWLNGATINDRYGNTRHDDTYVANTGPDTTKYVDIGAVERMANSGTTIEVGLACEKRAISFAGEEVEQVTCTLLKALLVGRYSNALGTYRNRAFIDFSTTAVPDTAIIDKVELTLKVKEALAPGAILEIKQRPQPCTYYYPAGEAPKCLELFGSITSTTVYLASSGWNLAPGTTKTVELGAQANADLQAQLGTGGSADGWFAVGLKHQNEQLDDTMELYTGVHKLLVSYHVNP
jgi:hypothetical protein